jgi:beta-lactamase class A
VYQKSQFQPDEKAQKINELEIKLSDAFEVIEELQKHNIELQKFITELNLHPTESSNSIKKKSFSLFQFKLIAITTGVAGLFIVTGFGVIKLKQRLIKLNQTSSLEDLSGKKITPKQPFSQAPTNLIDTELTYNVKTIPNFIYSQDLQNIVDKLVDLVVAKGKSSQALSITLIDANTGEIAEYKQQQLRYPASVVKLFWMTMFYSQLQAGKITNESEFVSDLTDMIQKSDNESASRVLDKITDTQSGSDLEREDFQKWLAQREKVNKFFSSADYQEVNLSQKTFPIPYLQLYEPKGRDLQMRGNLQKPLRNKITTQQASRLMYEIVTGQAVSPEYSQKMLNLLTIDSAARNQKRNSKNLNYFNSVRGFLGHSLPDDVYFAAKAGWTSQTRQETAYISTKDGKVAYILTIFAEDKTYAYDWDIFPEMSHLAFEQMTNRSLSRVSNLP